MVSCGGCELAAVTRTLEISLRKVPPTASPCKLQPVTSDPIAGVINLYEKCYAMPVTTLNYLWCYGRAVGHLICNVKENDKASFFSKSLTSKLWMLHFALFWHVECCDGRIA